MSDSATLLKTGHVPGEVGIWTFVLTDLTVFTFYFVTFFYQRGQHPADFHAGASHLSIARGTANTVALLTASLFVAVATHLVREGNTRLARILFGAAALCGAAFIANKPFEWLHELDAGFGPHHDNFFQLYYMLTGLHLAHVIVAMAVLYFVVRATGQIRGGHVTPRHRRFVENGATYWHLVDAIWLILFAVFYLVR
ncbi:cytochrome c oxidase subunit 3 [Mycolicibacterium pulveris]|uniref:Probable cytochrome c oxidase subunit 3 n=1 Tax=Mycolicibacterium pulveris TaxID=36813 RepID=A0A7I7UQ41_MYCPV|nr:cytochrome c oxidase subunit 3 [Mycolicibacterium pulveris]MCV6983258.1 cytochrome c oxidase subunit 3 [Mycolicibacterium pulveris]BBY83130.1 cytochrome c oxidase subunit III [Mycolicibacterium pulveris]